VFGFWLGEDVVEVVVVQVDRGGRTGGEHGGGRRLGGGG
jgi:hypothetical protein